MIKVPSDRVLQYIKNNYSYDSNTGTISQHDKKSSYNAAVMKITIGKTEDGLSLVFSTRPYQVAWFLHYKTWATQSIDHIDGNRKNNSVNNLRLATPFQNSANSRKTKSDTISQYKGVSKNSRKWRAYIHNDYKTIHLGYYETELEAALAYDVKAIELFGQFACLNFPQL